MKQSKAREIVASLSSLYPLQDFEAEAINTLIEEKETKWSSEYETTICPCCGNFAGGYKMFGDYYQKFCDKCGQPLVKEE